MVCTSAVVGIGDVFPGEVNFTSIVGVLEELAFASAVVGEGLVSSPDVISVRETFGVMELACASSVEVELVWTAAVVGSCVLPLVEFTSTAVTGDES